MHSKELLNWNIRGYAVIKGELLDLMDAMDNEFQRLFSEMQPQLADYPNMMDLKTIGRLSYLHNFPQHATFAAV